MKAYDTLWGYCAGDQWLANSTGLSQTHTDHYFPCAMALRLMPCSPRRRIRLVTVAAGLMADRSGWIEFAHRQLGTSNGCRDHTVLPYATSAVRPARPVLAHGVEPALRSPCAPTLSRPPHPLPAFVTIAIRPSCRGGTGRAGRTDLPDGEGEIFFEEGWTTQIKLKWLEKSPTPASIFSTHGQR